MPRVDPWLITTARRLRRDATDAERQLWFLLRGRTAAHWRRQQPVSGFVVDFYSAPAKLAVELDGGPHFEPVAAERDRRRDEIIGRKGVRVLRFDNSSVLLRTREVAEEIWRVWRERWRGR